MPPLLPAPAAIPFFIIDVTAHRPNGGVFFFTREAQRTDRPQEILETLRADVPNLTQGDITWPGGNPPADEAVWLSLNKPLKLQLEITVDDNDIQVQGMRG